MIFPSIKALARALRDINADVDEDCDVRLQVSDDGWAVRWGDASYDTDHRGYWGVGSVPGHCQRFNSRALAKDLIDQAQDAIAQDIGLTDL